LIAVQFYRVQELLSVEIFFAVAFGVLAVLVGGLYMLQKIWERFVERLTD